MLLADQTRVPYIDSVCVLHAPFDGKVSAKQKAKENLSVLLITKGVGGELLRP